MRVSTSEVKIDAPIATVWSVLTEAEHVKQWQYGSELRTDWSVGSPVRFVTEWEGTTFEQWGEVLLVDAPRELRYSLFAPRPGLDDKPQNRFTMIYSLSEDSGRTTVTITQEDPRPGPDGEPAAEQADESDEEREAENAVLAALKGVAESLVAERG